MLKALLLWETISSNFALNCWMLWLHCPSSIWAGSHPTSQKDMFQFWKKKNSRATIAEGSFILRMFKTRFLLHFLSIFYHNVVLFAEKGNRIKSLYIWCYLPPLARTLSNYAPLFHSGQYLNPAVRWVKLYLQNVSTYSCTQKNIIELEKKRSCSSDEVQDNDKQTWRNTILYIIIPRPNWRHNSWTFEL